MVVDVLQTGEDLDNIFTHISLIKSLWLINRCALAMVINFPFGKWPWESVAISQVTRGKKLTLTTFPYADRNDSVRLLINLFILFVTLSRPCDLQRLILNIIYSKRFDYRLELKHVMIFSYQRSTYQTISFHKNVILYLYGCSHCIPSIIKEHYVQYPKVLNVQLRLL